MSSISPPRDGQRRCYWAHLHDPKQPPLAEVCAGVSTYIPRLELTVCSQSLP